MGVNITHGGLDTVNKISQINMKELSDVFNGNSEDQVFLGDSSFSKIQNFSSTKINNTTVNLVNTNKNLSINVSLIDNALDSVTNGLLNNSTVTSNQTINQNGINVYYLYEEGDYSYNANVYFNKNNQSYLITGKNINYNESDYFINNVKEIINSMNITENTMIRK